MEITIDGSEVPVMAKINGNIRDYPTASEALGERKQRKIARNTVLHRRSPNVIEVRLHDNAIIEYVNLGGDGGHLIGVDDCGWPTVTTRDRVNQLIPSGYGVSQRNGIQYLQTPTGDVRLGGEIQVLLAHESGVGWTLDACRSNGVAVTAPGVYA